MNTAGKIAAVLVLIAAVGITVALRQSRFSGLQEQKQDSGPSSTTLPRLVDLGAGKCIPCKMMAPILEDLKTEYAGKFEVVFIDVWENPDVGTEYGIRMIPTQIFYDASGKELFRHEGFFSKTDILTKWKELGVDFASANGPGFSRLEPLTLDTRPPEKICYMCDEDIGPKTKMTLKTDKGNVNFCGPHCYFIMYTSLLEKEGIDEKVAVTDWKTGRMVPAVKAFYLYGMDLAGRPTITTFANSQEAETEQEKDPGTILNWQTLKSKEMSHRCGFCDRAVYPEDSAKVIVQGGMQTWGCCPMCALGVAARTGKDIEIFQKDALTADIVHVKTTNGSIGLLKPSTAVAWAGKKKTANGKLASTGCFKQAFFINENNLKEWVNQHPANTGMMISIHKALAAKMKLSPEQISKACKIGECSPK